MKNKNRNTGVYLNGKFPPNYERFLNTLKKLDLPYNFYLVGSTGCSKPCMQEFNRGFLDEKQRSKSKAQKNLIHFILKKQPRACFNIGDPLSGGMCALPCLLTQTKFIFRFPGLFKSEHRKWESTTKKIKSYLLRDVLAEKILTRVASAVAKADNQNTKADEKRLGRRIHPLINPINKKKFKPKLHKKQARTRLNLPPSQKIILYVGRFNYAKCFDYIKELINDFPNIYFILIRDDHKLKNKNNVLVKKYVQHERIPCYYWAADVLLHPSRSESGGNISNTVIEALAAKTPVIVQKHGNSNVGLNSFTSYAELKRLIDSWSFELDAIPDEYSMSFARQQWIEMFSTVLE